MAKTKRRSSRRRNSRRRRNPVFNMGGRVKRYSRRRRRNPSFGGGSVRELGGTILWGTAGAAATRIIPQMVLSSNNQGVMGYGANLLTAVVGGSLVGKFAGSSAGAKFTAGGAIALGLRLFSDLFGPKLMSSGLNGDLDFDLGYYLNNSFPLPTAGAGPYLLNTGYTSNLPMAAGGVMGSPIAQISPAPGGTLQPSAPGAPAVSADEPGRWASRWAA